MASIIRLAAVSVILCALSVTAHAACGTRGGPGYRSPDGKCVGWAALGRVCGSPPTTRCTPEKADADATDASVRGVDIDNMKKRAHSKVDE